MFLFLPCRRSISICFAKNGSIKYNLDKNNQQIDLSLYHLSRSGSKIKLQQASFPVEGEKRERPLPASPAFNHVAANHICGRN